MLADRSSSQALWSDWDKNLITRLDPNGVPEVSKYQLVGVLEGLARADDVRGKAMYAGRENSGLVMPLVVEPNNGEIVSCADLNFHRVLYAWRTRLDSGAINCLNRVDDHR